MILDDKRRDCKIWFSLIQTKPFKQLGSENQQTNYGVWKKSGSNGAKNLVSALITA